MDNPGFTEEDLLNPATPENQPQLGPEEAKPHPAGERVPLDIDLEAPLDIDLEDLDEEFPPAQTPPRTATSPAPTPSPVIPQNPPARDAWYLSASGQVFGPYHTTTLWQWLRDGQISWDSLVSRGQAEPWRPARQVVEFIDPEQPYGGIPTPAGTPGPGVGPLGPAQPGLILPTTPPKSPAIAVLLNLLAVGIGYVYLGQVAKGLVVLFGMLVGGFVLSAFTFGLSLLGAPIVWVGVSIDAYQLARKLERGQPINEWETFPR